MRGLGKFSHTNCLEMNLASRKEPRQPLGLVSHSNMGEIGIMAGDEDFESVEEDGHKDPASSAPVEVLWMVCEGRSTLGVNPILTSTGWVVAGTSSCHIA